MTAFSEKFIAYIDVLGFKKLVSDSEKGTGLPLPKLLQLLENLGKGSERERFEKHGPTCCPGAPRLEKNMDFRVTQISDCVIVSAEVSPAGAINLISHCWGAVISLLGRGIMCRGYIKRGMVYHTDKQIIGPAYQDAFLAESQVSAFKREADERGTPYVEVDMAVKNYIDAQPDACTKMMFERMVKQDGATVVLFPFKRLQHSFIVGGYGGNPFDANLEKRANDNLRISIASMKAKVWSFVDQSSPSAVLKAKHYIDALDEQLRNCDKTDDFITSLGYP